MDLLENYYGKQTFLLYSLFVKVPGTRAWPRKIFVPFSFVVLLLVLLFQVIKLATERFKREVLVDLLPTTAPSFGTLAYVPYAAFATENEYKRLLSIMINDLREERTEEEEAIKMQYASSAKMFISVYTIMFMLTICGMPLSGFVPYFLDMILPLNESRGPELFISGEIFIDQEKHFYLIYFVESCFVLVMGIFIGVSENMGVIIGHHYCGMIAILGYRLENLTLVNERKQLEKINGMRLIANKLKKCISAHQIIEQFGLLIVDFFDVPLTLIIIGTFTSLTISLVQVTNAELINVKIFFFTIAQVFQLFILSYLGQSGTDASETLSVYAYNADWYICPPNVRKLLQMIILRTSKLYVVIVCSMYTLTLASFMSVMQTITSFYMVLRQTQ